MRLRMCEKSSTSRAPTSPLTRARSPRNYVLISRKRSNDYYAKYAAHTTRVRQSDRNDR
jgi:hypothetical protein